MVAKKLRRPFHTSAEVVENELVTKPVSLVSCESAVGIVGVPVSCEYGNERPGSVVMLFTELVAARK